MATWKLLAEGLIVIVLLFFAIPIHVPGPQENNITEDFLSYIKKFNKTYQEGTPEYDKRFEAFKKSLLVINSYNERRIHNDTAIYGLTPYSDLTEEEFQRNHLTKQRKQQYKLSKPPILEDNDMNKNRLEESRDRRQIGSGGIPSKVDWRTKGIISDVKSQGLCGACWAYSIIHTVEAMYAKSHNLTNLSVQQMIDCARNGIRGCLGGDPCNLLSWLVTYNITIHTEKEYPLSTTSNTCQIKNPDTSNGVHVKKYTCFDLVGNENNLLKWLAYKGPVAVAINALTWQNYLGGVIQYHCDESRKSMNHAVQIVGYDLTAEIPYYIVKNSWGTSFGNKGYVYLAIGENICGLANEVAMISV